VCRVVEGSSDNSLPALSEAFRCCRSGPDALLRNLDSRRMQLSCACRESAAPSSPGTTLNFRAPTDLITSGARSVPHQLPLAFPETETVRECLPPLAVRPHVQCPVSLTLITLDPQFLRPITDHRALFLSSSISLLSSDVWGSYGYVPTAWVCGLFIGLFGLSTCEHLWLVVSCSLLMYMHSDPSRAIHSLSNVVAHPDCCPCGNG
jgi:hypothetical protein